MKERTRSLILLHSSLLLFGVAGLFGKWITAPAETIVVGRTFFGSLAILAAIKFRKEFFNLSSKNNFAFCVLGVVLAFHWFCFFHSIQLSSVSVGVLTFAASALFVAIFEALLGYSSLTKKKVFVSLLIVAGLALVVPDYDFSSKKFSGFLWGIASAISFAILQIGNKRYVESNSPLVLSFVQNVSACVVTTFFAYSTLDSLSEKDIVLLMILGVVVTGAAHTMFIASLKHLSAYFGSIATAMEPVYGLLFAALLLHEQPELRMLIGGVVIIGSILVSDKD